MYVLPKDAKLEPGDLLFIAGSDGTVAEPGHVMIFIEDGWVFQAPFTGEDVGKYAYDTTQYDVATRPALALPLPVVPPTVEQLAAAKMVLLPNQAAAFLARRNGWTVRYWIHQQFLAAPPGFPTTGLAEYANIHYESPRPARQAGKRGVRINELHLPDLELHKFKSTAPLPPLPTSGDVRCSLENIGMLGNDEFGDCGPAATEHIRMMQAAISTINGQTTWVPGFRIPHTAYTEGLYFAYGRAMGEGGLHPDQGVANATWLLWLYQHKIIEGFAEVNVNASSGLINGDNAAARAHRAMIEFQGCLVAVSLTDDAEQLFQEGLPWTTANGETPDPQEGHDIALGAYSPTGDTFGTWGAWEESTIDWDNECIGECWVIVTKELAERSGYNFAAMTAVLDTLVDAHLPAAA